MKTFKEVEDIVLGAAVLMNKERVDYKQALGRVLAEDVFADIDLPPFDRSAMDGYACHKADVNRTLRVVEEIPAGNTPSIILNKGEASKIMTGAPIPTGADWVVRIEDIQVKENNKITILDPGKSSNIRLRGEDMKKGGLIIAAGTRLNVQHIGNLASVGKINPLVYQLPRVGIMNTGSEIVNPEQEPGQSQIRNSNGPQMSAQLQMLGIEANDYGISMDDKQEIRRRISEAVAENEVVLISGGVSAGDFDFVPQLLEQSGFNILVHKMKVRPGKPLLFAINGDKYVFGIPGNPVSTLVQYEVIIKRFLLQLMGIKDSKNCLKMLVGEDIRNKESQLRIFLPVKFIDGEVFPVQYNGSGHLSAYSQANGIMEIPEGTSEIKKGDIAYVRPF